MKTIYILFTGVIILFFGFRNAVYSQAGSVELQDGGGTFISSHASIQEAYNAIPAAISSAYIIEILEPYNGSSEVFPINLALKTGHSSLNTITIRPDAGNTGEVISSSNTGGIVNINDADYIILDGRPGGIGIVPDLEIRNTATTGSTTPTVYMLNGATHCEVRYIKSYNATAGQTGPKNILFGASPSNPTGVSDNLVEHCYVSGGRTAVGSDGGPISTANPNFRNVVRNCTIVDFGFAGIWFLNASAGLTVEDCYISNSAGGVSITNPYGINIQSTYDGYELNIRRNKIIDIKSTSTSTGLNVRGINTVTLPGTGSVINIENNFISLNENNNNAATVIGILSTGTVEPYTMNIYNNSIQIGGTHTGGVAGRVVSAGIVKQSIMDGIVYNQKNNICINNRTGGTSGVIHAGSAINAENGTLDLDYNIYFATGSSDGLNSYPAVWDSVGYDNLNTYKALSGEDHTRFKNVNFVSGTDLHLTGSSIGDGELAGLPIAGITDDIDGDVRSATNPYRGADESTAFTLSKLDLTIYLEACSPVQDTIDVLIRSASAPYDLVDSTSGYINSNGEVSLNFVKPVDAVNYYIVVKHRNSIETWSKSGGEVFTGGALTYDFTTAASQAYGNNEVLVGSDYAIYTGDVGQDGTVDLSDLVDILNNANAFTTGYVVTDLNCNMIVDLTDLIFAYNNSSQFVSAQMP